MSSTPISLLFLLPLALAQNPVEPPYAFPDSLGNTSRDVEGCWVETLIQKFHFCVECSVITLSRQQRASADANSAWTRVTEVYSTRLRLTAVAPREGGDVLFVAGIDERGHDVIERWSWRTPNGQWMVHAPDPTPEPIGTPMPQLAPILSVRGGGAYVPPSNPADYVAPSITPIHEAALPSGHGSPLGHIRSIAADPEGRFLYILSEAPRKLYRLDLVPAAGAPVVLHDTTTLPALAEACRVSVEEHVTEGRKLFVDGGGALRTMFSDANNDGLFEAAAQFTPTQWAASPYVDTSKWRRLYWAAAP